ncbi:MAG: hypothetical protein Tsb0018_03180 [Opitutales bacterium]
MSAIAGSEETLEILEQSIETAEFFVSPKDYREVLKRASDGQNASGNAVRAEELASKLERFNVDYKQFFIRNIGERKFYGGGNYLYIKDNSCLQNVSREKYSAACSQSKDGVIPFNLIVHMIECLFVQSFVRAENHPRSEAIQDRAAWLESETLSVFSQVDNIEHHMSHKAAHN